MLAREALRRSGNSGRWSAATAVAGESAQLPPELAQRFAAIGGVLGWAYDIVGIIERRRDPAAFTLEAFASDGRSLCRMDGVGDRLVVGSPVSVIEFVDGLVEAVGELEADEGPTAVRVPQSVIAALRSVFAGSTAAVDAATAVERLVLLGGTADPDDVLAALERDQLVTNEDGEIQLGSAFVTSPALRAAVFEDEFELIRISHDGGAPAFSRAAFVGLHGRRHALLRGSDDRSVISFDRMRGSEIGALLMNLLITLSGPARMPAKRPVAGTGKSVLSESRRITDDELQAPDAASHDPAAAALAFPGLVATVTSDDADQRARAGISVAEGRAFSWRWSHDEGTVSEIATDEIGAVLAGLAIPESAWPAVGDATISGDGGDLESLLDAVGTTELCRAEVAIAWYDAGAMTSHQCLILIDASRGPFLLEETDGAGGLRWSAHPVDASGLARWATERLPPL